MISSRHGFSVGTLTSACFSTLLFLLLTGTAQADPFPPEWSGGAGGSIHYQPVNWPTEPANPLNCGSNCGDWKAYTRFQQSMNDPRTNDPSNGGTSPQAYVNVASSCSDKAQPSIYYYLHQGATEADDVLMFRWRVESAAHNYATGPSAGSYGASNPWSSALWTVLFDLDGSGYRSLAAHLDGSSGSPAKPIDLLVGIWGDTASHSLDYVNDPKVHLLGHNPTAFIGPGGKILNFQNTLNPAESWPNGSAETVWDYGTTRARKVSQNSCTEYFIDYQIPIALLDASGVGGPKITRSTPISMLFCTANSLNNPFQKDCAVNKAWGADTTKAAPFGDYLSFNQTEPYSQPIIAEVSAEAPNSCPGSYSLQATVQDTLALQGGGVATSVQAVDFYYWFDANGDGEANDAGSEWNKISPAASLEAGSLNKWSSSWDASSLPKGKYLIGAQALDDNTRLDDNMAPSGINNRTFSYVAGDSANKIYVGDTWIVGQQAAFPEHAPSQIPDASENWYGNPDVTGNQVALIGTAINACGIAPEITLNVNNSSVVAGDDLSYSITLSNPLGNSNAVTFSELRFELPSGFSYQPGTSVGTGGLGNNDPDSAGQTLSWSYGSPISLAPGASITMTLGVTATSTSGNYNASAEASSSFGELVSTPVAVAVDAARIGHSITPSSYSVPADATTNITFTLNYSNDSTIDLDDASIASTLPAGSSFVSCSGGCSNNAGVLDWPIGALAGAASGSVSLTLTVPGSWSSSSLTLSSSLSATAPDSAIVSKNASASVAVTGYIAPGVAALSLSKSASLARIAPGATVTYTLNYSNTGSADASDVVITDTLPGGMSYSSATGGGVHSLGVVSWNIGTVAQGASGSVTVTATAAAAPFTYPNPTTNNASINWTGGAAVAAQAQVGISGDYCSAVFYFHAGADNNLATIRPASQTIPSDSTSYTTTLSGISDNSFESYTTEVNQVVFEQNAGLGSALDISNQTLTIDYYLSAAQGGGRSQVILRNHTQNTTIATSSELNIGTGTGSWYSFTATIPPGTSIGANDKLRWYFQFRASGGKDITFHYDSSSINSRSSFCTATGPAVLSLSGSVSQTSIVEATSPTLTYSLNYANTGGTTATNVVLTGNLPSGFSGCEYSADASNWSSCSGGSSHNFATIASLAAGASGTVYVRGQVPAGTSAGDTLTASPTIDSDQTSASSIVIDTSVTAAGGSGASAELALLLTVDKTSAVPGDTVTYSLQATNIGSASATNVVITNALPVASYYTLSSCTGGCIDVADTLSWNAGSFSAGQSKTYSYTMIVGSSGLAAGIYPITDDLDASGDAALSATSNSATVAISGNPALSASMTASPDSGLEPGDTITYNATITNTGTATATAVTAINPIPGHTQYAGNLTSSSGSSSFDTVNNQLLFAFGDLAAGASVNYSFEVEIGSLASGATVITHNAVASATNSAQQDYSANANASAAAVLELSQSLSGSGAYPAATVSANSSGTTLFVDRTDRFQLNQLIMVGSEVREIMALGSTSLSLNNALVASSGDAVIGALSLTLSYRNIGTATATNVTLSDSLPAGLGFYAAADADSSPANGASGTVSWSLGSLAVNASGTQTIQLFPTGSSGLFTVEGLIEASNASDATADASVVIGGIAVDKTTSTPLVSAGGLASYTITLTNSLGSDVNNVALSDWLPAGFSYVDNSALVAGSPLEPTFAGADSAQQQPGWDNLTVPANDTIAISFDVAVAASAGASTYQNEVAVTVPAGVGLAAFDPIRTSAEDVTVLAANSGVLKGYAFYRSGAVGSSFDPLADTPLAAVRVEVYQSGADCSDPYNADCYVAYTNSSGYFELVLPATGWYVKLVAGDELDASWSQTVGTNNSLVTVADQATSWDHNGFTLLASSSSSEQSSSTASSSEPSSSSSESSSSAASSDTTSSVTASVDASSSSSESSSEPASSSAESSSAAASEISSSIAASEPASSSAESSSAVSIEASSSVASSEPASSSAPSSIAASSEEASSSVASSVAASSEASSSSTESSSEPASSSAASSIAASVEASSSLASSEPASSLPASSAPASSTPASSSSIASSVASSIAASSTPASSAPASSAPASSTPASSSSVASLVAASSTPASSSVASSIAASSAPASSSLASSEPASSLPASSAPASSAPASSSSAASSIAASVAASVEASSSAASSSSRPAVLALVDENGQNYSGETLLREEPRRFRVLGGQGQIRLAASVLRAGNLALFTSGTATGFFADFGATLTDLGGGNYSFSSKRAGVYSISFSDELGQEVSSVFVVHPRVAFTSTYQLGTQGVELLVSVVLDDDPVDYPVLVPFSVQGRELLENSAAQGEYRINSGHQTSLRFKPVANSGSVTMQLQQDGLQNATLGGLLEHQIELVAPAAVPLNLTLSAEQAGVPKTLVLRSGGQVSLNTSLTGPGYSYNWSGSAAALGINTANGSTALVDPSNLDGRYLVRVQVTELAAPNRSLSAELYLRVEPEVPAAYSEFLNGQSELEPYQLPICMDGGMDRVFACSDEEQAIYMETLDTFTLHLGATSDYASWRDGEFALSVEQSDILDDTGQPAVNQVDREYNHQGYRVDFELTGLEQAGQSVPVVIPLKPGLLISANSVWRKYVEGLGWRNFVEDERNQLASAKRLNTGLCPWAGAQDWRAGLNTGDDCVRLIIEDGGPNDGDASADMVIRDPSTLASKATIHSVDTLGKGGGGALIPRDLLLLTLFGLFGLCAIGWRNHRNEK